MEGQNCSNCRYGWDTGGQCGSIFYTPSLCPKWRPLTEAQMLEKYYRDNPKQEKQVLVGNMDTGYAFTSPEKAVAAEREMKNTKPIKIPDNLGDLLLDMARTRTRHGKEYNKMYKPKTNRQRALERIKKVIFNDPCTIVIWNDGTKTVVKAENEPFDPEKGLAMAISKYFFDNQGYYYDVFKKWIPKEEDKYETALQELQEACDRLRNHLKDRIDNPADSTLREFCQFFDITKDRAYGMIKRGELEAYKDEKGKWMIPFSELERMKNND